MNHVVYCLDENYEQHFGVSLTSLLINYGDGSDLTIHVIIDKVSETMQSALKVLRNTYKSKINVCVIGEDLKANLQNISQKTHLEYISSATFFRLAIAEILDESIEKVLYLDSDTVIQKSIKPLFEINFDGNAVLGTRHQKALNHQQRLGVPAYLSAGVLLMDLVKCRVRGLLKRSVEILQDPHIETPFMDQDAINIVFQKEIGYIDPIWNVMVYEYTDPQIICNSYIAHYNGFKKPWQSWYPDRQGGLYRSYLAVCPWKNTRLISAKTRAEHRMMSIKYESEGNYQKATEELQFVVEMFRAELGNKS